MGKEPELQADSSVKHSIHTLLIWVRRLIVDDIPVDGSDDRKRRRIGMLSLFIVIGASTTFFVDILCSLCGISFLDKWAQIEIKPLPDQAIGPAAASIATTIGGAIGLWTFFYASREKQDSLSRQLLKDRAIALQTHERELEHETLRQSNALRARWESTLESNLTEAVKSLHSARSSEISSALHTLSEIGRTKHINSSPESGFHDRFPFYERCAARLTNAQRYLDSKSLLAQCSSELKSLIEFGRVNQMPWECMRNFAVRTAELNSDCYDELKTYLSCFENFLTGYIEPGVEKFADSWHFGYGSLILDLAALHRRSSNSELLPDALSVSFGIRDSRHQYSKGGQGLCDSKAVSMVVQRLTCTSSQLVDCFQGIGSSLESSLELGSCCITGVTHPKVSVIADHFREILFLCCEIDERDLESLAHEEARFVLCGVRGDSLARKKWHGLAFYSCDFYGLIFHYSHMGWCKFVHCDFRNIEIRRSVFLRCVFLGTNLEVVSLSRSILKRCWVGACTLRDCEAFLTWLPDCNLSGIDSESFSQYTVANRIPLTFSRLTFYGLELDVNHDDFPHKCFSLSSAIDAKCLSAARLAFPGVNITFGA